MDCKLPCSFSVPVQYFYNPTPLMGRTACAVPQCLYSTSIPILSLCAVRPVQGLSACTVQLNLYDPYRPYATLQRLSACTVNLYIYSHYGTYGLYRDSVPVQYSYTSTPPMGRTACTEPQYLYSTAIPLLLWAVRPVQSLSACTVQLYLYCYGPYCLYRASVPVQGCTIPYTCTPLPGLNGLF